MSAALGDPELRAWAGAAHSRLELWQAFVEAADVRTLAEIGVYRGDFAAGLLAHRPEIERYHLIDPWRHLEDWNKPANKADDVFEGFYRETLDKTEAWAAKRVILRGRTSEVVDEIADGSLDLAYVDGDHTLRGITIDLVSIYPKVADGGWIAGDDFCPSIWQHDRRFEPTLVFPFAVHFAEAMGDPIYALPFNQFLIRKGGGGHAFVDHTGRYGGVELNAQLAGPPAAAPKPKPKPQVLKARRAARRLLGR